MNKIERSKIQFYLDEHEREEEPSGISTNEEGEQNDVLNE